MSAESRKQSDRARHTGRSVTGRAAKIIAHEAAEFIRREADTESLITVIRVETRAHGDRMLVFVSVFPIEKAHSALAFLERQRKAFSDHLKVRARMRLPRVDFMLDNSGQSGL